ncbi:hypothetical protein [Sphingomicrobium flavum]|uniref:hypothetical protein n=1 Tax=Sphingomicrobium flavum TaxID=1229164 RepID=UPI0021ADFEF2|nr:hypothetical protein [Sphingomicrobium flavum]
MLFRLAVCAAALTCAPAAFAQDMNAQELYERATKLKKKGPLALLSSDVGVLKKEIQGAAAASKAQYEADKKAGRQTRYCPPKGGQSMTSDELMAELAAIPEAERRRINSQEFMTRVIAKKSPCRSA